MNPNPNHSPSRERVERYAGPLRRYFRENPFEKRKVFYTFLAICSATLMLGIWTLTRSDRPYSHGPVADVHTSFDANCEACHKPQSLSGVGLSAFNPQARWLDLQCQTCHAGPDHHRDMKWPADWPKQETDAQCAACHHDHNGKDFSLVRLTDDHCLKCHGNLADYHKAGTTQYAAKVTNFADPKGGHPEFKKLEQEKAKPHERGMKFSHAHHMTAGIGYADAARGKMTKADLAKLNGNDPNVMNRYKFAKEGELVQMECASCHQLDGERKGLDARSNQFDDLKGNPKESILPPRGDGGYYLPINYEAHCQACHPLKSPALTSDAGQKFPAFDLPHRKQPAEMKEVLRARYSGYVLTEKASPELMNKNAGDEETFKVGKQVESAVNKSLGMLFASVNPNAKNAISGGKCTECHNLSGNSAKVEDAKVVEPNVPTVWFEHSKFNHKAHRGYSCIECHPNTAPAPLGKATFSADAIYTGPDQKINIEGVESCRKCHTPTFTRENDRQFGGVRSNCTDCHRYHNGDNPFQGLGAAARDPHPPKMKRP
jgi:hypothetical protein